MNGLQPMQLVLQEVLWAFGDLYSLYCLQEDEVLRAREDLMDTILEEEEQLITAHRLQVRGSPQRSVR